MEVYVYMMRADAPLTASEEETLKCRLSAARQNKIEKLRYAADKRLSLGAGLLLDYGLDQFGLKERDETFAAIENGKPCLKNHPEIQFNLSHSGSMVMAAFTCQKDKKNSGCAETVGRIETEQKATFSGPREWLACPVGCDVERKQKARMEVARRFFAPAEQQILLSAKTEEERDLLFGRLWTLKESFLKVEGKGMAMPLDSFAMELGDPSRLAGERASQYRFQEFELPDYCASVCVKRKNQSENDTFFFSFQNLQDMV